MSVIFSFDLICRCAIDLEDDNIKEFDSTCSNDPEQEISDNFETIEEKKYLENGQKAELNLDKSKTKSKKQFKVKKRDAEHYDDGLQGSEVLKLSNRVNQEDIDYGLEEEKELNEAYDFGQRQGYQSAL